MKITNRGKDALKVRVREARIVVMDDAGTVVWEDADESRMVHRLFEFVAARDAINALDETTDALERHEGRQPHYVSALGKVIARNRLIVAESIPSPRELATLLSRSMQLDLWRRAA